MKILQLKKGKPFSFGKSVKKLLSFLVVALMLSAGNSVYAYTGSIARGDDYPVYYKNGSQEIDRWRLYSRQCTSFAAFRLSSINGFELPVAYGNANEWGHRARREGYRVDNRPTIGSIAWSTAGIYGHVAWVSNVIGDQIEIEEYNYGYTEAYNKRIINSNTMTGFIHFKDLASGNVGSSQASVSTRGTHDFKAKAAVKDQPLASTAAITYYYPGEKVHYDQVLEKDGYKWLSYLAYNGSRRYIQLEAINKNLVVTHTTTSSTPSSTRGRHYFKEKAAIKNQPLASASVIAYYYPGENVYYDQVLEKDGYKWLSYLAYNGSRRYIQLAGVASSQNQSGNSSNYSSNNNSIVGWKKVNGSWYHFKSNGSKSTGWLKDGSRWYYLKSSGEMQTGWLRDNGRWYYLDSSGAMKTGWYQVSGRWYYSYSSGALAVNTRVDGYRVDGNGARI